jgi:hypothetical protein
MEVDGGRQMIGTILIVGFILAMLLFASYVEVKANQDK